MKPDLKCITEIISNVLPKNKTKAIYIFGSYNTDYFDEDSDIDIGWFSTEETVEDSWIYEEILEKKIERKIDLVIVNENTKPYLLGNILGGIPIGYMSPDFEEWFDKNIYEIERDMEDILELL